MISWYDAVLDKAKEKAWVAMAAENNLTEGKSHRDMPLWATLPLISCR